MKKVFRFDRHGYAAEVARICSRGVEDTSAVEPAVRAILDDVAKRGDKALVELTNKFDRMEIKAAELRVPDKVVRDALDAIPKADRKALEFAAARIRSFHEKQMPRTWVAEEEGAMLGSRVTPLDAVGLYVPGGKASYPSSVLMNAIPAKVAGVARTAMVTPTPGGELNKHVLAAAAIVGVDEVYRVGGAQAVAALAYGTKTIKPVDKIVGPGNIYVATAKRLVYGRVDIDMVAGPSEIFIVNDGTGEPSHIAADLLSQAEHDEMATTVLATTDEAFAKKVAAEVENMLKTLPRAETARKSWTERGAIFVVADIPAACALANRFAAEHLELAIAEPFEHLGLIRHAGAIFLGHNTPEALGDYAAGPNHVLPTAGTARFYSPLGVEDFIKRSSLICFSKAALLNISDTVMHIAKLEGLTAHAAAVEVRVPRMKMPQGKNRRRT